MESEELIRQIMAEVMANLGSDQVSFAKKPAAAGAVDASSYPLGERMPEKIKAATGKVLADFSVAKVER